tara:strand:+ start:2270 stop:2509 length:240 start_codon:yes stop_codon:yes gene_type:complete
MKPNFLPILLIKKDANSEPKEVPTIIKAVGNVTRDLLLIIVEPIIPLKKTVIGAAVKENICDKNNRIKFLLNILSHYRK